MPNERVIEIPWALSQLPQSGILLDIGSCEAGYLRDIVQPDRQLECLDPRGCAEEMPQGVTFYHQSIIGNTLPRQYYDAVLLLSVLEHIGLPCYGQEPFPYGDKRTIAECWALLKPGCPLIATVPAGQSKVMTWYRQYNPDMLELLFAGWRYQIRYWGFNGIAYVPIRCSEVEQFDYRDRFDFVNMGAGAIAGIVAYRP